MQFNHVILLQYRGNSSSNLIGNSREEQELKQSRVDQRASRVGRSKQRRAEQAAEQSRCWSRVKQRKAEKSRVKHRKAEKSKQSKQGALTATTCAARDHLLSAPEDWKAIYVAHALSLFSFFRCHYQGWSINSLTVQLTKASNRCLFKMNSLLYDWWHQKSHE